MDGLVNLDPRSTFKDCILEGQRANHPYAPEVGRTFWNVVFRVLSSTDVADATTDESQEPATMKPRSRQNFRMANELKEEPDPDKINRAYAKMFNQKLREEGGISSLLVSIIS